MWIVINKIEGIILNWNNVLFGISMRIDHNHWNQVILIIDKTGISKRILTTKPETHCSMK